MDFIDYILCTLDEYSIHPERILPDSWIYKRGFFYHIIGRLKDSPQTLIDELIHVMDDEQKMWKILYSYEWAYLKVYQGKSPRYDWVAPKKKLVLSIVKQKYPTNTM